MRAKKAVCPHFSEPPRSRNTANDTSVPDLFALHRIDLACFLEHGAFELHPTAGLKISDPSESLIFFMLRLLDRLRAMGTTPAADLMEYGRTLRSFQR